VSRDLLARLGALGSHVVGKPPTDNKATIQQQLQKLSLKNQQTNY
jgi:hypothetical protein